jgi:hypothetical protein
MQFLILKNLFRNFRKKDCESGNLQRPSFPLYSVRLAVGARIGLTGGAEKEKLARTKK